MTINGIKNFICQIRFRRHQNNSCKKNSVIIVEKTGEHAYNGEIKGLKLQFLGSKSCLRLFSPLPRFVNCSIVMGNDSYVEIKSSIHSIKNLRIYKTRPGSKVLIGENFSCEGVEFPMQCEGNLTIKIGDDCMFSHDISLMCTDSHAIIDLNTGHPINFGKDIEIGNHVWLAPYCMVFKGVTIADDNIVGAHSIVTRNINESHTISVGSPARITSRGKTWSRLSAWLYSKEKHEKI